MDVRIFASRKKRMWMRGAMGIIPFLFGLMFLSSTFVDPEHENVTLLLWLGVAFTAAGIGCVVWAAYTPEITKTQQKIDQMPKVPVKVHIWHVYTKKVNNAPFHSYCFFAVTDSDFYFGDMVDGPRLAELQLAAERHQLVALVKFRPKWLKKTARSAVIDVKTKPDTFTSLPNVEICLTGSKNINLRTCNHYQEVAAGVSTYLNRSSHVGPGLPSMPSAAK